jgi:hypothetical protein
MVALAPGDASTPNVTSTQQLIGIFLHITQMLVVSCRMLPVCVVIGSICVALCAIFYALYENMFARAIGSIKDVYQCAFSIIIHCLSSSMTMC